MNIRVADYIKNNEKRYTSAGHSRRLYQPIFWTSDGVRLMALPSGGVSPWLWRSFSTMSGVLPVYVCAVHFVIFLLSLAFTSISALHATCVAVATTRTDWICNYGADSIRVQSVYAHASRDDRLWIRSGHLRRGLFSLTVFYVSR